MSEPVAASRAAIRDPNRTSKHIHFVNPAHAYFSTRSICCPSRQKKIGKRRASSLGLDTGDQATNSSTIGAWSVSWELPLAIQPVDIASPALFDGYNAQRLPTITEMLQRTAAIVIHIFNLANGPCDSTACWEGNSRQGKAAELTASTYVAEEGGRLRAGDKAPDASRLVDLKSGAVKRLFNVFGLDSHCTRLRRQIDGIRAGAAGTFPDRPDLDDRNSVAGGHTYPADGTTGVATVQLDGVVGAFVGGALGVENYFVGVFVL
ncbi:hypothetical protein EVG20_g7595 [Dentipellis fragilis]|uniref:Uncharacterized protein n=1 Tax=Dentipellis fragilis TaxID=205917 RepID=A0A4Y9YBS3_9AGAM|nr:hypothetical protein EVG20_g7595 [Dentipellis fragilis]